MNLQTLQNIRAMLNRVAMTGPEAIAWCQAVSEVEAEIKRLLDPEPAAQPAAPPA